MSERIDWANEPAGKRLNRVIDRFATGYDTDCIDFPLNWHHIPIISEKCHERWGPKCLWITGEGDHSWEVQIHRPKGRGSEQIGFGIDKRLPLALCRAVAMALDADP